MAIRRDLLRNSHGFAQVVSNSLRVCISVAMSFLKRQTVEVRHSVFHYSKAIGLDQFIVGHGQIELGSRCRLSNIGFAQERAFVFRTKRTTHGSINTRKLRLFKRPDEIYGTSIGDPNREFGALPEEFHVYRGYDERGNARGLSWTADRAKAEWFARRWSGTQAFVAFGRAHKKDIFAYFVGRKEKEVVILPSKVTSLIIVEIKPNI